MGSEPSNRDFEGSVRAEAPARVEDAPMPVVRYDPPEGRGMVRITGRPGDIIEVLAEYQQMQQALDKALPDCIMQIQGRQFRKKAYWRAVKTQFSLSTEITRTVFYVKYGDGRTEFVQIDSDAQSVSIPGGAVSDWGFIVYSKAIHGPTGINGPGMGGCAMTEKASYRFRWEGRQKVYDVDEDGQRIIDEAKTADNATVHNVLSHAQTRSINRAIADLVGFGEVTADELHPRTVDMPQETARPSPAPPPPKSSAPPKSAPAAPQAAPEGKGAACQWCDPDPQAAEGTEGCAVKAKDVPPGMAIIGAASVDAKGWLHLGHVDGVFRMSKANASAPDSPFPAWLQAGMILQVRTKKQLPSGVGFLAEILRVREPGPPPVEDGEIVDEEPAPFDSTGAAADGDGAEPSSPPAAPTSTTPSVERDGNLFKLSGDAMPDASPAAGAPAPSMSTLRNPAPAAPKALVKLQRKADTWLARAKLMLKNQYGQQKADRLIREMLAEAGIAGPVGACGSSDALAKFIAAVDAALDQAVEGDKRDVPY